MDIIYGITIRYPNGEEFEMFRSANDQIKAERQILAENPGSVHVKTEALTREQVEQRCKQ